MIGPMIVNKMNVSFDDIKTLSVNSSANAIAGGMVLQFFSTLGIFLLPALLFAYFTHPRPLHYLGIRKPANLLHLIVPACIMICAGPLLTVIAEWMSQFDLGEYFKKMQEDNDRITAAFLSIKTPAHLIISFIVLAIMPGLSEELFFRGILMRFAAKRTYSTWFPLVVSSLLFATFHLNIYGWPSIFVAGMLLGSFYYLTGSIIPGILAHFAFNGSQVFIAFYANNTPEKTTTQMHTSVSWVLLGTSLAVAGMSYLWQTKNPLKPFWASDFDPEETLTGTE
jgi:membrane protease YdiL (CAAX protease family)